MADSESDEKREQVAQVYAGMSDGELQKLAEEAWTLMDIGKEALKIELARRGLEIELANSASAEVETNNLITSGSSETCQKHFSRRALSNQLAFNAI